MVPESSFHPTPPDGSTSGLLAEVETAVAMMGLARISSPGDAWRRIYENTKRSYDRALMLVEAAAGNTTSPEQEIAVRLRLKPVREWPESMVHGLGPTP
jgi:hypothetical protein